MAIRDKLRAKAGSHLRPGEQIQQVFVGQSTAWWVILFGAIIFLLTNTYYVVVVTDQRILLCRSGKFSTTQVNEVLGELPRQTRIGPAQGLWYKTEALGRPIWFAKRFHSDINAADGAIPA